MHPSFEQFVAALRDPSLRPGIGLVVGDADAAALMSRQDWASDYYHKWLALFPVAAAAAAAPPAAPAVPVEAPAPAPASWQYAPAASRLPSRAKLPLIIGASVLGVLLLTAGAVGVYTGLIATTPVAQHSSVSTGTSTGTSSGTSSGTTPSAPATEAAGVSGTHGLTPEEFELMDAAAAPSGHSIEDEIAHGLTDAQLRSEADLFEAQIDKTCSAADAYPQGIQNATFKASFVAGYAVQVHITTEQATAVYTALVNYCLSI